MQTLIDNIDLLIEASTALIVGLAEGLIMALPTLLMKAPEIIAKLVLAIIEAVPKLLEAAVSIITTLAQGIAENFGKLTEKGGEIVDKVKDGFMEKVEAAKNWGRDLIQNFVDGLMEKWNTLKQTVRRSTIVADFLGFSEPQKVRCRPFTLTPDMMNAVRAGIKDNKNLITSNLTGFFAGKYHISGQLDESGWNHCQCCRRRDFQKRGQVNCRDAGNFHSAAASV